jgi:hypothetical protein
MGLSLRWDTRKGYWRKQETRSFPLSSQHLNSAFSMGKNGREMIHKWKFHGQMGIAIDVATSSEKFSDTGQACLRIPRPLDMWKVNIENAGAAPETIIVQSHDLPHTWTAFAMESIRGRLQHSARYLGPLPIQLVLPLLLLGGGVFFFLALSFPQWAGRCGWKYLP